MRLECGREPIIRYYAPCVALTAVDHGLIGIAQAKSCFNNCVEHRLQIEGRAANDLHTSLVAVWYSSDS